jgi:hypothetical protein
MSREWRGAMGSPQASGGERVLGPREKESDQAVCRALHDPEPRRSDAKAGRLRVGVGPPNTVD